jgi:hypothetical protein
MVKEKDTLSSCKFQQKITNNRLINSNTSFDFSGRHMTAFGGTFLVGSLIERIGLIDLLDQTLTVKRKTALSTPKMITALVYLLFIGLERLNHIVHIAEDQMILRLLGIARMPVQSTFWRLINKSLHKHNERQFQNVISVLRERVWTLSNVKATKYEINTDTTPLIAYGNQDGAKVGYCPKDRGAKCFKPIISSLSQTGEIIYAQQRKGDRIGGLEIAKHLKRLFIKVPADAQRIWRADSEFYCKEAVMICEQQDVNFVISVRKTAPIMQFIRDANWTKSKLCDGLTEFYYQPIGWARKYRFIVARYEKKQDEQTELFEDTKYKYRAFVTDMDDPMYKIVKEYDGRAGIENLIEEAKNQIGFSKIPGKNFTANSLFLQIVVLSFNLCRYLQLFGRSENGEYQNEEIKTIRHKTIFISAKIADHARYTEIHFGGEYPLKNWFSELMRRIRKIDLSVLQPVINRVLIV